MLPTSSRQGLSLGDPPAPCDPKATGPLWTGAAHALHTCSTWADHTTTHDAHPLRRAWWYQQSILHSVRHCIVHPLKSASLVSRIASHSIVEDHAVFCQHCPVRKPLCDDYYTQGRRGHRHERSSARVDGSPVARCSARRANRGAGSLIPGEQILA